MGRLFLPSPPYAGHTRPTRRAASFTSFHPRIVRGTPVRNHGAAQPGPFIPAYAGQTCATPELSLAYDFHPRIRGADWANSPTAGCCCLSSPPYAGQTTAASKTEEISLFHPRIRGADRVGLYNRYSLTLSSPHTRGRQTARARDHVLDPFIPAYAGQTRRLPTAPSSWTFHPRIRGADSRDWFTLLCPNLSSPHTRGRLTSCGMGHRGHPFIPAYAGQTPYEHPRHVSIAFHPRIRGADAALWYGRRPLSLSSPHTRGRRAWYTNRIGHYPFIPAYAGQTIRRGRSSRPPIFHPRIRGADTHIHESAHALYLSSPHTRGRLHGGVGARSPYPFIPAYAGQTLIVKERNYLIFLCRLTVLPTSKNPSLSTIL